MTTEIINTPLIRSVAFAAAIIGTIQAAIWVSLSLISILLYYSVIEIDANLSPHNYLRILYDIFIDPDYTNEDVIVTTKVFNTFMYVYVATSFVWLIVSLYLMWAMKRNKWSGNSVVIGLWSGITILISILDIVMISLVVADYIVIQDSFNQSNTPSEVPTYAPPTTIIPPVETTIPDDVNPPIPSEPVTDSPLTTTPEATTDFPFTTTPDVTTDFPLTTTDATTDASFTTTPDATTDFPLTTTDATTDFPFTTTPDATTDFPFTTTPDATTDVPLTTTPDATTDFPFTTTPDATTESPLTTTPDATTDSPFTTTPDATTDFPFTTTPDATTDFPLTTTPDATTDFPLTTTPDATTDFPFTTTPDATTDSPLTTTPDATTDSPLTTTPDATTDSPFITTPDATTDFPFTTTPDATTDSLVTTTPDAITDSAPTITEEAATDIPAPNPQELMINKSLSGLSIFQDLSQDGLRRQLINTSYIIVMTLAARGYILWIINVVLAIILIKFAIDMKKQKTPSLLPMIDGYSTGRSPWSNNLYEQTDIGNGYSNGGFTDDNDKTMFPRSDSFVTTTEPENFNQNPLGNGQNPYAQQIEKLRPVSDNPNIVNPKVAKIGKQNGRRTPPRNVPPPNIPQSNSPYIPDPDYSPPGSPLKPKSVLRPRSNYVL